MKNCFNYFSYPLVGAVLGLVTAILFITVAVSYTHLTLPTSDLV